MDDKLKKELEAHRETRKAVKARQLSPSVDATLNPVRRGKLNTPYTDKQKLTALQAYALTGSWVIASKESGIQYNYMKQLGLTQWWKDSIKEIKQEEDEILDIDLSGMIKEGVIAIKDRLKNGDYMWNSKDNKFTRKPLKSTDALRITTQLMDQRNVMRGKPTRITEQVSVTDRLNKLAMEFEKFQRDRTVVPRTVTGPADDVEFIEEPHGDET